MGGLVVVSTETGEVISSINAGDRILRRDILKKISDDPNKILFTNGEWGKAYSAPIQKLAAMKLTSAEYAVVLFLITHVKSGSGLIVYGNYRPMQAERISETLGISERTASRALDRLAELRIISIDRSGGDTLYFFNPFIYQRGKYINKTLYQIFKKSVWAQRQSK